MADNNKKQFIKYESTTYLLEDHRLPDPTAEDNGKVLGVVNGEYALKTDEAGSSIVIDPTPTSGSENAVSSGGVYTALRNGVGWVPISTGSGGDLVIEPRGNGTVTSVEAYYCAALGLVRVAVCAVGDGSWTQLLRFGMNSKYKPYIVPYASGAFGHCMSLWHGDSGGAAITCTAHYEPYVFTEDDRNGVLLRCIPSSSTFDSGTEYFVFGLYYTEDIPAGGES